MSADMWEPLSGWPTTPNLHPHPQPHGPDLCNNSPGGCDVAQEPFTAIWQTGLELTATTRNPNKASKYTAERRRVRDQAHSRFTAIDHEIANRVRPAASCSSADCKDDTGPYAAILKGTPRSAVSPQPIPNAAPEAGDSGPASRVAGTLYWWL